MEAYSIKQGEELVKAARHAIELCTTTPQFNGRMIEKSVERFTERKGVFVTIEHYPTKTMRGNIGITEPIAPLSKSLVEAAVAAAIDDPGYVPVSHHELDEMVVSVSILAKPEKLKGRTAEVLKRQIKIGRDGLMIRYGYHSGILLPIVPIEQRWNKDQFLDNLCINANLPLHIWKTHDAVLYRFGAQLFRELSPRGPIEEIAFE
ncbi:MAG: TIGR00296 family protein [Candidatus Micrarchaeota archaeon]|nr:TIGR00296 family protein [Candidatus Micrarchaeota archaeon]MDE1824153.1 TIGR00296 family protein [Candidatus Micrarchaeota archaeon]MDE1849926.1 TIGR00296 family protein [Candidatus Micrarchaeota archaeon]